MSATLYSGLIQAARFHMRAARGNPNDSTYRPDAFWSDDELFSIALRGTTDLWGAIIDLHEEHYLTVDTTNVTYPSSTDRLAGVPSDCFRVYLIEPADPTTNQCAFVPRAYNHIEFINARNSTISPQASFSPTSGVNIFYNVTGQGTPNQAPVILCAPKIDANLALRFSYISNLGVQAYQLKTATNPIAGESDNALIAWITAYALGKEQSERMPNAAWLAIYQTEKQNLLTRMKPRQEQEPIYADGVHDSYWR
jgi:hypothetical protein